jgi:hypothetical protein
MRKKKNIKPRKLAIEDRGFVFQIRHKLTRGCLYFRAVEEDSFIGHKRPKRLIFSHPRSQEKGIRVIEHELQVVKSKAKATRFPTPEITSYGAIFVGLGTEHLDFSAIEV